MDPRGMRDTCICSSSHKDTDSYPLLDIKDIFVLHTIGWSLFFLAVTMQIKHVNLIKTLHKTLAHPSEGEIIKIPMIGNESKNAVTSPFNAPLGKANKLH